MSSGDSQEIRRQFDIARDEATARIRDMTSYLHALGDAATTGSAGYEVAQIDAYQTDQRRKAQSEALTNVVVSFVRGLPQATIVKHPKDSALGFRSGRSTAEIHSKDLNMLRMAEANLLWMRPRGDYDWHNQPDEIPAYIIGECPVVESSRRKTGDMWLDLLIVPATNVAGKKPFRFRTTQFYRDISDKIAFDVLQTPVSDEDRASKYGFDPATQQYRLETPDPLYSSQSLRPSSHRLLQAYPHIKPKLQNTPDNPKKLVHLEQKAAENIARLGLPVVDQRLSPVALTPETVNTFAVGMHVLKLATLFGRETEQAAMQQRLQALEAQL